jgi:hypothetical protein
LKDFPALGHRPGRKGTHSRLLLRNSGCGIFQAH